VKKSFDRRDFLKLMGLVGLTVAMPWPRRLARAQMLDPYTGPVFVTVAASGGWDPTSFCDPKINVPGNPEINRWARTGTVQTITGSPIRYAPFANNGEFFTKFHRDMLVVNGIDTQTNSHDAGVRNNWSGRLPPGYPSFSALVAGVLGDGLSLPYLTNAGYRETAGLSTYTELSSARDLQDLVDPNRVAKRDRYYYEADELGVIEQAQRDRTAALADDPSALPRRRRALENLALARASRDQLQSLVLSLPTQLVNPVDKDGFRNPLLQQAQLALVCAKAGLTVACDLEIGGFDTHQNHDASHRSVLMQLENGVTYLWDAAEQMGIDDRLIVLVASDFGRTPSYNNDSGKDHWPISSAILMKRGAAWANRVIGASDAGHNGLAVDSSTLTQPSAGGVRLRPSHVHAALRRLAGVQGHAFARRFPLDAESVDFFAGGV
jgi:hypothetical protein